MSVRIYGEPHAHKLVLETKKKSNLAFFGGLLLDHVYLLRLSNLILQGSTRPCDFFRLNNAFLASGLLTLL